MSESYEDDPLLILVRRWRDAPARPQLRGLPAVKLPATALLRPLLPEQAAARLLTASYTAALKLSQPAQWLRQAGVASLAEQRQRPLALCDAQAQRIAQRAGWLAASSGAALGVAGAAGWVADVPTLLLQGLRTLIRIGYCHGEFPSPALVTALFALASADTEAEKRLAWNAVLVMAAEPRLNEAALRDGLERAVEREFAKQALNGSLQRLLTVLMQRFGLRKAAGALPVVGAAVGAVVNRQFVQQLAEAARMAYIARRLRCDGLPLAALQIAEPLASAKPHPRRRPAPAP